MLVPRPPFILPAQPTLRDRPPKGERWVHEVKFDGYRVQLHKDGKEVVIYSRNGIDFTERFPSIAYALARFPAKRVIIDAEVVAVTAKGLPNFFALHLRRAKPDEKGRLHQVRRPLCVAYPSALGAPSARPWGRSGALGKRILLFTVQKRILGPLSYAQHHES